MGIFLFMLFFQPFPIRFTELNNVLVFNAGFGAIVFILLYIIQLLSKTFRLPDMEVMSYFNGFVLFVVSSVAFTFYLMYVGRTAINFYSVSKIILICIALPAILWIYRIRNELKQENDSLNRENVLLQSRLRDRNETPAQNIVEFYSADSASELLRLSISDILLIKSADNYVEIYYIDHDNIRKRLVRNTLKNIEQMLRPYDQFIRCHRTFIIHVGHIERIHLKINSSYVVLKKMDERIPVSRPYVLKLKEAMAMRQG
ncbi:MAG: LytTR family transcriptional regulator [Bacteroidales bacterium]|nr:LytTR family transcriptional regulator [Bacteroidales bacterium]